MPSCKCESYCAAHGHRLEGDALLHCALEGLNEAVLSDALAAKRSKGRASGSEDGGAPTSPVTPLEPDLADLLEGAGLSEPLEKVGPYSCKETAA
jgi:hypothetical protein